MMQFLVWLHYPEYVLSQCFFSQYEVRTTTDPAAYPLKSVYSCIQLSKNLAIHQRTYTYIPCIHCIDVAYQYVRNIHVCLTAHYMYGFFLINMSLTLKSTQWSNEYK